MDLIVSRFSFSFLFFVKRFLFSSANYNTAHGKERTQELGQQGSSRQPNVVGCTAGGKEVYFGELKGTRAQNRMLTWTSYD